MYSKILILLFFVALALCDKSSKIDDTILADVFGAPGAPPLMQASAVTPHNGTLTDPEYWDSDKFTPSIDDYDKFDWTITKRVAVSSESNFLLSPLGLKLALAILTEAATGPTQTELVSVLGFEPDRNKVRCKFSSIISSLETKSSKYILNLGSRIYMDNSAEPRQRFAAIGHEYYKTDLFKVNFSQPIVAAKEINTWIANLTDNKIEKLVDEDEVNGLVLMVLDAIYFKGTWRHQFDPNNTKSMPFYVSGTAQKPAQFMNIRNKFYYADSTKFDAKILRLPYLGNKFSMYLVVPNSLTGLPRVFAGLSELRAEMFYLQERLVDVTLPKLKFDYTAHLDGLLKELGIRQAFEDTASFPGIARGQQLHQRLRVSRVLQKSGIEANELGSTVYSATEISLMNKFGEDTAGYQEFIANKPFLFFIEDEATKQLLFTGRVSDPSVADGTLKLS